MNPEVAGFVLAGGKSSRMGRDKAQLKLDGETLAARAVRKLRYVCAEVAIAGDTQDLRFLARVIPDESPGSGPLGGVVTALAQSPYPWNLFLAVDMPFVPEGVLRTLIAEATPSSSMIVLAEAYGIVQPLCGLYAKEALPALRIELAAGRLKMKNAVAATASVRMVPFADLAWFRNLNTPEDYRAASGPNKGIAPR